MIRRLFLGDALGRPVPCKVCGELVKMDEPTFEHDMWDVTPHCSPNCFLKRFPRDLDAKATVAESAKRPGAAGSPDNTTNPS